MLLIITEGERVRIPPHMLRELLEAKKKLTEQSRKSLLKPISKNKRIMKQSVLRFMSVTTL